MAKEKPARLGVGQLVWSVVARRSYASRSPTWYVETNRVVSADNQTVCATRDGYSTVGFLPRDQVFTTEEEAGADQARRNDRDHPSPFTTDQELPKQS